MKVILRKEHEKLGPIGTLVDVKDGFARNYPDPAAASPTRRPRAASGRWKRKRSRPNAAVRQGDSRRAKSSPANLEKVSLTVKMKVGEDEKLFGSVTSQMVADALKEQGFTIDKRSSIWKSPSRHWASTR